VTRRLWVFPLYHQVEIRDATEDVDRPRLPSDRVPLTSSPRSLG
jgi:hypothetical protein